MQGGYPERPPDRAISSHRSGRAERHLLSKTGLAAAATAAHLERLLVSLNPGATRHVVSNGEIAPDAPFGAALFDPARKTAHVHRLINEIAELTP